MALRLYNTLSAKVEDFQPLDDGRVRMYACGPTVYDYGHIGNFRTFVAVDLLYRFLRQSGYDVRYVMNITDVDDKIIRNSAPRRRHRTAVHRQVREGIPGRFGDPQHRAARCSCAPPSTSPRWRTSSRSFRRRASPIATDDGSYYFRIAKFPALRQVVEKRFCRHGRRRPRRRGRVRERQRPRLRPLEGSQAGRSFVGHADWPGASRLAHRVLRHVDGASWARVSTCTPAARTSSSPITKTKLRNPRRSPASSSRASGSTPAFCWSKARRCRRASATFSPSATWCSRDTSRLPSAGCSRSVPYRNQLNFTFDGLKVGSEFGGKTAQLPLPLDQCAISRRARIRRWRNWPARPSSA